MDGNLFANFTFNPPHHRPSVSTSSAYSNLDDLSPSSSRSSSPPPISPTSQPSSRPTSTPSSAYSSKSTSITDLTTHFSRSTIEPRPQPLCARLASQPSSTQPRRRSRRDACDPTRLHGHLDLLVRRLLQEGMLEIDEHHPSELNARGRSEESCEDAIMETDEEEYGQIASFKSISSSRRPSRNAVQKAIKIRKRRGS